jgi:diguanylate cyclase (GGDEF)-like protein
VHADDRERVGEYYERCLQGFQLQTQYRITRPDGTVRWIDARSFPVRDEAGKFVRLVGIAEDITERKKEERLLAETHEKLNATLRKAEEQAHDSTKLTELVDILQSCQTVEEAYAIAASVLPGTFSAPAGALCITSPSRNMVEAVSVWGANAATEKAFAPDGCWALRRGKANLVKDATSPMRCPHVMGFPKNGYLCAPLAAQGETLGVLYLEFPPSDSSGNAGDLVRVLERQVTAVGERLSLALANLRLREELQRQSIRDTLTGLYNRRFMEESLARELGRASRTGQPVSMIMMDIDHFKRFNDTFGHQAGDALLKALGEFVNQRTRGQDVACRYGGEEFALILAGCSLENACKRAQVLREELKLLKVHGGQSMGAITLSMGVASFPAQANNAETLVKAADDALYRAKKEGRDRIVAAEGEVSVVAPTRS